MKVWQHKGLHFLEYENKAYVLVDDVLDELNEYQALSEEAQEYAKDFKTDLTKEVS